jgi:biopolymer transport protein ExbD/biopolymer transport protein TolR
MAGKLGTKGPMADINVTPLIDVVLVLLVVFMVITPLLQSGMPVDLPQATQTTTVNDVGQHIVVSVTMEGGWWVEQEKVEGAEALVDQVNVEYRKNPSRSILIKADRNLEYRQVREVMDVLAAKGMTSVLVAASKEP